MGASTICFTIKICCQQHVEAANQKTKTSRSSMPINVKYEEALDDISSKCNNWQVGWNIVLDKNLNFELVHDAPGP